MGFWDAAFLLDTTSAIGLIEEAERPDLVGVVADQAHRVEVPSTVADEIRDPETLRSLVETEDVRVIESWPEDIYGELFDRYPRLGSGELGVLARAVELDRQEAVYRCVLDDGLARGVASTYDLRCTGTIGVLMQLDDDGLLDREEHLDVLSTLQAEGFRYQWDEHPLYL